jgi:hypothetical protein
MVFECLKGLFWHCGLGKWSLNGIIFIKEVVYSLGGGDALFYLISVSL